MKSLRGPNAACPAAVFAQQMHPRSIIFILIVEVPIGEKNGK